MMMRLKSSNAFGLALAMLVLFLAWLISSFLPHPAGMISAAVMVILAAAMMIGACYHLFRVSLFYRRFPPPGRFVPVPGGRIHFQAEGPRDRNVTVVWIPGSHDAGTELEHLHCAAAKFTRSIIFDRIGSGWSSSASTPRKLETEIEEMKALLDHAGEQGPFLIVGHSLGGMLAANFVARHPEMSAGVILLDMGCTEINLYAEHLPGRKTIGAEPWLPILASVGLLWHLLPRQDPQDFTGSEENERRLGFKAQPKTHVGWISAYHDICADPLAYVRNPGALGDIPLMAVTPVQNFDADVKMLKPFVPHLSEFRLKNLVNIRFEAMKANARLSTQGELRFAPPGATHALPYEVPEFVMELVKEMLARISLRHGKAS